MRWLPARGNDHHEPSAQHLEVRRAKAGSEQWDVYTRLRRVSPSRLGAFPRESPLFRDPGRCSKRGALDVLDNQLAKVANSTGRIDQRSSSAGGSQRSTRSRPGSRVATASLEQDAGSSGPTRRF